MKYGRMSILELLDVLTGMWDAVNKLSVLYEFLGIESPMFKELKNLHEIIQEISVIYDAYGNNKVGPWGGIKAKLPFSTGELDFGVRYEYYHYTTDAHGNVGRAVAFITWGANGDWKKKKE